MRLNRIRNFSLLLISVLLLFVITIRFEPSGSVIQDVLPSVVYVEGSDGYYDWSGSGFVIDDFIITAGHVVDNGNIFGAVIIDGNNLEIIDYYCQPNIDVGILEVNDLDLPSLSFGNSNVLKLGDTVYIMGAPMGQTHFPSVTKGIVSGIGINIPFFGDKLLLQVDAASYPGNSGSAVFNKEGEVVGMLIGGYNGTDNLSLCVPSNIIKQVLEVYKETKILQEMK